MTSPDNHENPYANLDLAADDPIVQMRSEVIFQQARRDYTRRSVAFGWLWAIAFVAFGCAIYVMFTGIGLVKAEAKFAHDLIAPSMQTKPKIEQALVVSSQTKPSADGAVVARVNETKPSATSAIESGDYLPKAFSSSLIFMSVLASMFVAAAVTCALAASKIFPAPAQDKPSDQSSEITIPVLSTAMELVKLITDLGKK